MAKNRVLIDIDFVTKSALRKLTNLEVALGKTELGAQRIAQINIGQAIKTGAILATAGVTSLTAAIVALGKVAGDVQRIEVAFRTMLGSVEEADLAIRELQEFAVNTPFSLKGVETAAKQLLAVGIEVDNLIPTLKSLGDVSAGLSVPLERLILNFGQVRSLGRLTGRELRDFATAGVPLIGQLAKQLNIAESEILNLVSAGKIGFDDVEQAFRDMTSEGGRFANLMDSQSKTIPGIFNNLTESLRLFIRAISKELTPAISTALSGFAEFTKQLASREGVLSAASAISSLTTALLDLAIVAISAGAALVNLFSPDIESQILGVSKEIDKLNNTLSLYEKRIQNSGDASGVYARQLQITKERIKDLEKQSKDLNEELEKSDQGSSLTNFLQTLQQARDAFAVVSIEAEKASKNVDNVEKSAKRIPKEVNTLIGFSIDTVSLAQFAKNIRDFYETLSEGFTIAVTRTFETVKELTIGLQGILATSLDSYQNTVDSISNVNLEVEGLRNKLTDLTNGLSDEERLQVARDLKLLEEQRTEAARKQAEQAEDAAFKTVSLFVSQLPIIGDAVAGILELSRDPDALKGLVKAVTAALPSVINGLVAAIPEVIDALIDNVPRIIDTLLDGIPRILAAIISKAGDITAAIAQKVPDIIRSFVDNLPTIIDAIVDQIPEIIEAIIVALPDIIAAIIESLPRILAALASGVVQLLMQGAGVVVEVFVNAAKRFVDFIRGGLSAIFDPIIDVIAPIFDAFANAVQSLIDGFKSFVDKLSGLNPFGGGGGGDFLQDNIVEPVQNLGSAIGSALGLASGGVVRVSGASGIRDTVPAMLADGELVVDNQTTKKLDQFLSSGGNQNNDQMAEILLSILSTLQQSTVVDTSINIDGARLGRAILELKKTGQLA